MKTIKQILSVCIMSFFFMSMLFVSTVRAAPPSITNPVPGSTLSGSTETFSWQDNGTAVSEWQLYVGSSPEENDIFDSGSLGLSTSTTVSGLPTDGSSVYVTLEWKEVGCGGWMKDGFQYIAFNNGDCVCLWQQTGSDIYYNGGDVGIGEINPAAKLDVLSTSSDAITGETSNGYGVVGISTGCSTCGTLAGGIGGRFISTNALGIAMAAVNNSTAGVGVYGKADPLNGTAGFFEGRVYVDYRLGINTLDPQFTLDVNGTTRTNALVIVGGSDIAEPFEVSNILTIKPGMVVSIDPEKPGQLRIAGRSYDRTVAGIVSGANGINPGLTMSQEGTIADGSLPVALTGRVYAWVDASNGPIEPGNLLTTSDTPGHAMKVTDYEKANGSIIGKAMTGLQQGKGLVLVLISLQ
jgi:hypothetical protein